MTTRSPYSRLSHSGTAPDTTLASGVDASTLTVALIDGTGWPDGSGGSFVVIFEPGSSNEEKAVALSRSANTLTLSQRGLEGAAVSHTASSQIRHGLSAVEVDEANYAVSQTVGQVAAKGDVLYGTAANTFGKLAKGSANQSPMWDSTGALVAGNPAPAAHTHAESDVTSLATDLSTLSSAVSTNTANIATNTTDIATLTGQVAAGLGLLAHVDYSGAAKALHLDNSGSPALVVVDSTNLSPSFTVPSSGNVLIRVSGALNHNSSASDTVGIGWLNHTGGAQVGRTQTDMAPNISSVIGYTKRFSVAQTLTGLTAGAIRLDLAAYAVNSASQAATLSDVTIEVWAA